MVMRKDDPALYVSVALAMVPKQVRNGFASGKPLEHDKAVQAITAAIVEALQRQFELKFTSTQMRFDIAPGSSRQTYEAGSGDR